MGSKIEKRVKIINRKASFEYEFIDEYVAGIVLKGTEIKSIRQQNVSLQESHCIVSKGEVIVKGMHIGIYTEASYNNHVPTRDRKLLLNKREIEKIDKAIKIKGLTIVVKKLFITDRGHAKLEIAVARGKKIHDKRQDLKTKDIKREIERDRL